MSDQKPPFPPFNEDTAWAKVLGAEAAWNTRDPERVAMAYSVDSEWRNRDTFLKGRDEIRDSSLRSGRTKPNTHFARTCGPSLATASPFDSSTKAKISMASGGVPMGMKTGSSTTTG